MKFYTKIEANAIDPEGKHLYFSPWEGPSKSHPRFELRVEDHGEFAYARVFDRKEENYIFSFRPVNAKHWLDGWQRKVRVCATFGDHQDAISISEWESILENWKTLLNDPEWTFDWETKPRWRHPSRDADPGTHPSQAP